MNNSRTIRCVKWGITTWLDEHPAFIEERMVFLECVQHKAPDTGRLHWHSFIVMKNQITMSAIKKLLADNTAHCVPLRRNDTTYLEVYSVTY